MNIFLSEMQEKDVVSISGINLGHIVDIEIDNKGRIINFIIQNKRIFHKKKDSNELVLAYNDIETIGKDVILVRN